MTRSGGSESNGYEHEDDGVPRGDAEVHPEVEDEHEDEGGVAEASAHPDGGGGLHDDEDDDEFDGEEEDEEEDDDDEEPDGYPAGLNAQILWSGIVLNHGDDHDSFDDESLHDESFDEEDLYASDDEYESEYDSEDGSEEFGEFDEDAMHFDVEGGDPVGSSGGSGGTAGAGAGGGKDSRNGGEDATDPEEQGVYMLADGAIPSRTRANHQQGSDAVQAASPGRILITSSHDVSMLDASESPSRGAFMGATQHLPFQVYSVSYDADASLVAVCGAVGMAEDVNLAIFRVVDVPASSSPREPTGDENGNGRCGGRDPAGTETASGDGNISAGANRYGPNGDDDAEPPPATPQDRVMFIPVAEKGVGRVGRYGREMLNCVRFGKLADATAMDGSPSDGSSERAASPPCLRNVLLVASQDGNCYVLSVDVKSDAGSGGAGVSDGGSLAHDDVRPTGSSSGSDGGQGGRGPRRCPRLDAQLVEETRLEFPVAVNAAAAAPNGLCAAVAGDADFVLVSGGPGGYGAGRSGGAHSERLPIDGDPETLNIITSEPQGGMYVAWSANSEYLAATSDSLHSVAVWRVVVADDAGEAGERRGGGRAEAQQARGGVTDGGDVGGTDPGPTGGACGGRWSPLRIQRVAYLRDHAHPCLPVQFLPSDSNIVVWAERGGRVHAYDLRCANAASGGASSAVNLSPPHANRAAGRSGGRRCVPLIAAAADAAFAAEVDASSPASNATEPTLQSSASDDDEEIEGVDVSLYPLMTAFDARMDESNQRRFVQTVRSRVRGLYVTGLCAVAAPPPPLQVPGSSPGRVAGTEGTLGFGALRRRAPPHDLVFVGTPSAILRFRCPMSWTVASHLDFPAAFRDAARAFLLCAASSRREATAAASIGGKAQDGHCAPLTLGDMPQEVLLHVVALAAVPLSAWIGVGGARDDEEDGEPEAPAADGEAGGTGAPGGTRDQA